MKKLMTLALTGVLAAAALAVESAPSNTVGFISRSINTNTYVNFSVCPAGLAVDVPAIDILGAQGFNGDLILQYDNGWSTYAYTPDNTWGGLTLDYTGCYLYRNNHGAPMTLVVAGDVIPEGTTVNLGTFPGSYQSVGVGNPLPMVIDMDTNDLGLAAAGFAYGSTVIEYDTGWSTYVYDAVLGYGFDMMPGKSYIFRSATPVTWSYTIPTGALTSTPSVTKTAKTTKVNKAVELN